MRTTATPTGDEVSTGSVTETRATRLASQMPQIRSNSTLRRVNRSRRHTTTASTCSSLIAASNDSKPGRYVAR
jgi:hypothetical protein